MRDNDSLDVLECSNCGLVFLSSFDHIVEDFYENSGMHNGKFAIDIDTWIRETIYDDERRVKLYSEMIKDKDILDFGCGTGGFLQRVKQTAKNAYGVELEKRLQKHFMRNELTVYSDLESFNKQVDYIFLFHSLEHIKNPFALLEKLKQKLNPAGKVIIEVPNADDALLTLYKSKAFSCFTYWSPHLYLYNQRTLYILAKKAGLNIEAIKQVQRYPLSNHLYWLAKGVPGGHLSWAFLNNPELEQAYSSTLASLGKCDTIVGYFSLI
ncbi:MAG: class I SAM-dependent methyltransferase [Bacteroidales bacterium]|nr:class I SAM-dependent methyltransferase [Bacteroidales bacterium]